MRSRSSNAAAFVDAEDVAAVAAAALLDRADHAGKAWTVTGPCALSYAEVATILSNELGRPIRTAVPELCGMSVMPAGSWKCRVRWWR